MKREYAYVFMVNNAIVVFRNLRQLKVGEFVWIQAEADSNNFYSLIYAELYFQAIVLRVHKQRPQSHQPTYTGRLWV
jgi:hypothetical protein